MLSTGAAKGPSGGSPRFPALDPEPGHRPWVRILVPWIVLAAVGGLVAGVVEGVSGSSRPRHQGVPASPVAGAGGRVISVGRDGELWISLVDGTHATQLRAVGQFGQRIGIGRSLDGRFLVTTAGQVFALGSGRPVLVDTVSVPANYLMGGMADGDKAVVVQEGTITLGGADPYASVSAVALAGGKSTSLGVADYAAADPQQIGVFVAVAGTPIPQSEQVQPGVLQPDVRVELRDAGRPPEVLGTAASLEEVLGTDRAEQVTLTPRPDPAGDKVAVVVEPATTNSGPPPPGAPAQGSTPTGGIVVVDRTGRVIASEDTQVPAYGGLGSWSPDGHRFAFPTLSAPRHEVAVWTPGSAVSTRILADPYGAASGCLWSPDSQWLLCAVFIGSSSGPAWDVARAAGGPVYSTTGPGRPLAWLPPQR